MPNSSVVASHSIIYNSSREMLARELSTFLYTVFTVVIFEQDVCFKLPPLIIKPALDHPCSHPQSIGPNHLPTAS